jgi:hypothetical protein
MITLMEREGRGGRMIWARKDVAVAAVTVVEAELALTAVVAEAAAMLDAMVVAVEVAAVVAAVALT